MNATPTASLSATPAAPARRPIADLFRRTADAAVRFCLRAGIHPDTVSYASVVAATAAATAFWLAGREPWLLIPAVLFCYLRLWLNMLDGMVALAAGVASPQGEIVNELPDRISDVLIFVGVAHSGLVHPSLAYLAGMMALLVAYTGTLGQAVGAGRQFGGCMSKPWRMVALHVGAWAALGLHLMEAPAAAAGPLTPLDVACLAVLAGGAQSAFVRVRRTVKALDAAARACRGTEGGS